MDLNQVSALESHDEEILVGAIRRLKPADIIKSRVLNRSLMHLVQASLTSSRQQWPPSESFSNEGPQKIAGSWSRRLIRLFSWVHRLQVLSTP